MFYYANNRVLKLALANAVLGVSIAAPAVADYVHPIPANMNITGRSLHEAYGADGLSGYHQVWKFDISGFGSQDGVFGTSGPARWPSTIWTGPNPNETNPQSQGYKYEHEYRVFLYQGVPLSTSYIPDVEYVGQYEIDPGVPSLSLGNGIEISPGSQTVEFTWSGSSAAAFNNGTLPGELVLPLVVVRTS